jgi:uncharacterized protein YllA (UPF0747 family)
MQALLEHREELKIRPRQFKELNGFLSGEKKHDLSAEAKNIQKLRQPETVVVVANFYAGLFGGPAYQILKCLTAIKICEELAKHSVDAVPLCWVSADSPAGSVKRSITLMDHQSELHKLQLDDSESIDPLPSRKLSRNQVSALLSRIESIGQETYDPEILEVLKSVFIPGADFSSASARLISNLMSEWGMVVLNGDTPDFESAKTRVLASVFDPPGRVSGMIRKQAAELARAGYEGDPSETAALTFCAQNSLLPILAIVLDPFEVYPYATALPILDYAGLLRPIVWPQSNATLTDSRRRRILSRYDLGLHQLYSGEDAVIEEIRNGIPSRSVDILNGLKSRVDECVLELKTLAPDRKKFAKKSAMCREKILYQLEKLRKHYVEARARREQTVNRQMHKACNLLAPNRRMQERELAGIQIPLRYSRAGLRLLFRKLDISNIGHQLISMD